MWSHILLTLLQIQLACSAPTLPLQSSTNYLLLGGRQSQPEGYLPLPVAGDTNWEAIQPIGVVTSISPTGVVQVPSPQSSVRPDPTGRVVRTLEGEVRSSIKPLSTGCVPDPLSLLVPFDPALKSTSTSEMEYAAASPNIFQAPIATGAPSTIFKVKEDHPVPRTGIVDSGPHQTNKFYANFFLGNQNAPTFLHPYSIAWAKGQGPSFSWGLAVSHIEAHQRVYGQAAPQTGAAKYFLNPVGIQSLCLSAAELGSSTTLTLDNMEAQSVNVNLLDKVEGQMMLTFPLVQGMAYVTGIYHGSTPTISTGIFFKTVTKSTKGAKPNVTKYTIYLEDGKIWHLYAYSPRGDSLDLHVINNTHAKASRPYNGIVQVAKDPGGAETLIDASSGAYPTAVKLSGSVSGSMGTYTFKYRKGGHPDTKLLMYALPHHVECFDSQTHKAITQVRLQTTTKGMATAVVADSWTMVEPNMPVSMGFAPWDPVTGSKRTLNADVIRAISPVALQEISQNVDQQSNLNSMYFSGKASSWSAPAWPRITNKM